MNREKMPVAGKKEKLHSNMFKDVNGFPDQSMILERGLHINDLALRAMAEDPHFEKGLFSPTQYDYIKFHLPKCKEDCFKRFGDSIKQQELLDGQIDLPL